MYLLLHLLSCELRGERNSHLIKKVIRLYAATCLLCLFEWRGHKIKREVHESTITNGLFILPYFIFDEITNRHIFTKILSNINTSAKISIFRMCLTLKFSLS